MNKETTLVSVIFWIAPVLLGVSMESVVRRFRKKLEAPASGQFQRQGLTNLKERDTFTEVRIRLIHNRYFRR